MSLTTSLVNALTGLQTNLAAIQATSANISNVNTEGYSRKVHQQETRVLNGLSAGVETAGIIRQIDQFLKNDLIQENSLIGKATVRNEFFERIQTLFGSPGNNNALGNFITDLAIELENVANNPDIPAHRFTAVGQAQLVSLELQRMSDEIQSLRLDADQRIAGAVKEINLALVSIAELNSQISANVGQGLPTGDLEDQREAALSAVSQQLDIQFFTQADGQINVLTNQGRRLVASGTPAVFTYTPAATLTPLQVYPGTISDIQLEGIDVTTGITSGELAGLIDMRDNILPSMSTQIDQLTVALRDTINQIHNRGANTPLGSGQTAADAAALYGSRDINTPTDPLTLSDSVTFQILDSTGNPATASFTLAAGATTPAAIATALDGYLDSGTDFGEAAFVSNRLEVKLEPGFRLAILDNGPAANNGDTTITFDADGDTVLETYQGFSNFFGLNDFYETPDLVSGALATTNQGSQIGLASTIQIRADIFADPENLSRGMLRLSGGTYHLGVGDNEIAQQLAGAFNQNTTFASVAFGPPQATTTFSGYAGTILSFNAAVADDAQNTLEFRQFFFESLDNRVKSSSGVNLDEELANIVIFQNAYSASARVIQTTNELFDTLLSI